MSIDSIPPPRVIIFDNDGTLVPSHEVANPAIQEAFGRFCAINGIPADVPSDERIRGLTGQPGEVFFIKLQASRRAGHQAERGKCCRR